MCRTETILGFSLLTISLAGETRAEVSQPKPLSDRTLQRVISLDRDVYLLHEPVWLTTYIVNTGSETEEWHVTEAYKVRIMNSQGEEMRYNGPMPLYVVIVDRETGEVIRYADGWHQLEAGQGSKEVTLNLLEMYGEGNIRCLFYLPVGEYSVEATPMKSNVVRFQVVDPPTQEEQEAYELLMKAFEHYRSREYENACRSYRGIAETYPESRYSDLASYRVILECVTETDFAKEVEAYMSRHAESPFVIEVANMIIGHYVNARKPSEIERLMQRLADEHRNTLVAKVAQEVIERAQDGEFHRVVERREEAERLKRSYERD